MYSRKTTPAYKRSDGTSVLSDPTFAKHDFLTYFNAFSNGKWRRYTCIRNVHLRIVAKGTFEVNLVSCEQTMERPKTTVLATSRHEFDDYTTLDLAYPETDALLLSFELLTFGRVDVREAYYFTKIEESFIRPVELAVAMTTFRKEDYVVPNIELFREQVLGCDEPVASHFTLHVVDNGRTLDPAELESDRIFVHPNPNVGGAGGFTRGMIEGMEQEPRATHVLLMDDDVQISPESIKRTYNILALVNDEYRDAFVSGAMISFERQDEFHEDVGFVNSFGGLGPVKAKRQDDSGVANRFMVSDLEDVVELESLEVRQHNRYAGWWYCCIPVSSIERNGLPLPLFIRGDDVEYGNRCAEHFITMNGICIWHMTFGFKFRAALDRYQVIRNCLIAQATTNAFEGVDFLRELHILFNLDLKTFNYEAAQLLIEAVEDFLKGPSFLKQVNGAQLNAALAKRNEVLVPVEELDDPCLEGVEYNPNLLHENTDRSLHQKAYDYLTCNGQRGPGFLSSGGLGVLVYDGWLYAPNEIRGKDALLMLSPDGTEGVLRKKDRARFSELSKSYKGVLKEYETRRDEIHAEWAAAREELTSVEFWKRYLAEQARGDER